MVRPRSLVSLATALAVLGLATALGQEPKDAAAPAKKASAPPPKPAPAPAKKPAAKDVPVDHQPYRIKVSLTFEESTRVDSSLQAVYVAEWLRQVDRFVGTPWKLELIQDDPLLAHSELDSLSAASFRAAAAGTPEAPVDKVWAIRVAPMGAGYVLLGREFDRPSGFVGNTQRDVVAFPGDTPRGLLRLALALFAPTAEIGNSKNGGVLLTVRGASLPAASPLGKVVTNGTTFRALRLFTAKDGRVTDIQPIRYTYFRVDKLEGAVAECAIISGLRDPLTKRIARPHRIVALGIKPAGYPTRLRFVFDPNAQPAAGYVLTARPLPQGSPREVGMTDREGRIVVPADFTSGLVVLKLYAGRAEPMAEMPIMPGETPEELTVKVEPKPLTLTLEAQLDALKDQIVDLVAVRGRLEKRMQARVDGEDWDGLDAALKEYYKLPNKPVFEKKLTALRGDAEDKEKASKALVLTRNARAQLDEAKALIDRYLDDELFNAFADALEQSKAQKAVAAKQAQAKALAKAQARKAIAPAPAPVAVPTPAPAAPKTEPKAAPKTKDGSVPF